MSQEKKTKKPIKIETDEKPKKLTDRKLLLSVRYLSLSKPYTIPIALYNMPGN